MTPTWVFFHTDSAVAREKEVGQRSGQLSGKYLMTMVFVMVMVWNFGGQYPLHRLSHELKLLGSW